GVLPAVQGAHRRGIVHRLDRLTSGVILIGRTERAQQKLKEQFQERTVAKSYTAFVYGVPRFQSDWIETGVAPDPRHMGRYRSISAETDLNTVEGGRTASTYYEVKETFNGFAELECRPKSGRTHQIRVHMTSIGMPLIGDSIYRHRGARPVELPDTVSLPGRHALHASSISFEHPVSGERVCYEAPLSADLVALREGLRKHAPKA
ncbi:MAG: 23S rRNA pseudouridine1911/1915/1917 synthase, partial [Planctomycetota bacterium]